ncbi:DUF2461 domain-containing protein [Maritalea porphyrae]|uniref:TIGR02453 family protein n=1 Tax=Maritalea porphyrae TaxID=880732 RepID=A0ABQ5UQ47_9HYPH|nr:DUF2461 domain-containing protein [Maritalea porphyrae]GLQ16072.1 TIGR02453 family protein [Maritalea porphyrae]
MIGEEFRAFLRELNENNDRAWFEANKPRFQNEVVRPCLELIGTVDGAVSQLNPPLRAEPKINGSLRRIYRDTRFSKDKTPYHTHVHLIFWTGGHPNKSPATHIVFNADSYGYGAGHWALDKEQLDRMRQQIVSDEGNAVSGAVEAVCQHGVKLDPPALARVPRGYDKDADYADWLRQKALVVKSGNAPYPKALENLDDAANLIVGICEKMSPLNRYLVDHVWV